MGRKLDVATEAADANDEESELLQPQLQHSVMQSGFDWWRLRRCVDVADEDTHAALGILGEGCTDEGAQSGVDKADEVLGREMGKERVNSLRNGERHEKMSGHTEYDTEV